MNPQSLKSLEKEMAFTLLGFLEHETSLANERGFGANAAELLDIKQELEERLGRRAVTQPLESVANLLERRRQEVRDACRQNLVRNLGELVERHNATCGWVFLFSPRAESVPNRSNDSGIGPNKSDGTLTAVASYNAPSPTRIYSTENPNGIVARVARTWDAYRLNENAASDPNYVELVANTVSEVAIPIFAQPTGFPARRRTLVGVLNLEANYPHAFGTAVPLQLAAQTTVFSLDLLCMRATLERSLAAFWHPGAHGWSFRNVVDAFCTAIAEALPTETGTASLACAGWYHDINKQRLFVRGTAGFDFEYVKDRTLSDYSAIGDACKRFRKGEWKKTYLEGHELIFDIREFRRRAKAKRMEMRSVGIFPFTTEPLGCLGDDCRNKPMLPGDDSLSKGPQDGGGALVFYGFEHQYGLEGISVPQLLNANVGERLARQFASLIDQLRNQRLQVARCYLESQLKTELTAARSSFEIVVRCFKQIFDADGVSIFSVRPSAFFRQNNSSKFLKIEATTGLIPVNRGSQPPGEPLYEVERYKPGKNPRFVSAGPKPDSPKIQVHIGLTNYLAMNANVVFRKNDVLDMLEPVVPFEFDGKRLTPGETLHFFPKNLLLEAHAPGAGEHMRFIGASVGSFEDKSKVFGAIRITRGATRAPFTESDEELLVGLLAWIKDLFHGSTSDRSMLQESIRYQSELGESIANLINLNNDKRGYQSKSDNESSESRPDSNVPNATETATNAPAKLDQTEMSSINLDMELSRAFNQRFGNTALDQLMKSIDDLMKVTRAIEIADDDPGGKLRNLLIELLLADQEDSGEKWLNIRRNLRSLLRVWKGTWNVSVASCLVQRLQQRRLPSLVSADCDIAALLEDTAIACEQFARTALGKNSTDAVVLSCLRFVEPTPGEEESLRVVSVYPSWSKEPAEEDQGEARPRSPNQKANGWRAIEKMLPMTFRCTRGDIAENKHRVHPLTAWVTYGVLVPFKTFAFGKVLTGIISVDLAGQLPRNSESEKALLKTLAIAASKCMWTLAAAELALIQKPAFTSIISWSKNLSRTFALPIDRTGQPRLKLIRDKSQDWPKDGSSEKALMELTKSLPTSEGRVLGDSLEQLFSLGSLVRIVDQTIIFRTPLITINGVLEWLELSISSQAYQAYATEILDSIRVALLQFLVLSNDSKVSRNAFIKKDFDLVDHDSSEQLDFWRLVEPAPIPPPNQEPAIGRT